MEYVRTGGNFPCLAKSAVTLGKFDGLHRGHRELLRYLCENSEEDSVKVLFALGQSDRGIFSSEERRTIAETLGMDLLIECPLNDEIRVMEPEEFIQRVLVERLHVSLLVVGEDYRFGYGRKGDVSVLRSAGAKYGFEVKVVPQMMEGDRKISSTYIREELLAGNMEQIQKLLGTRFFLDGKVVHGKGLGHRLLLPTANLIPPITKLMPPNGVYMTVSHFEGKSWQGITNVGYNPTVEDGFLGAETYLFDCAEDLYGKKCRVEFYHYKRPEQKFASLEELRQQLFRDAEEGRRYFEEVEK